MVARHRDEPSGWRPSPNRRENSEPLASLPTTSVASIGVIPAPKRGDIGGVVIGPAAEGCGAGDQRGRAGVDRLRRGGGIDPAVDLDIDGQILLGDRGWRSPRSSCSWLAMNFCPPKPGLTLITSTRSISSIT